MPAPARHRGAIVRAAAALFRRNGYAATGINEIAEVAGFAHYTAPLITKDAPFNDNNIRLALKYAINRQEIVDKVLFGHGSPGLDNPIAPGVPQPKLTVGKYDVAVDTGPSFTTRRNAAVAGMTEFIRANPQAGPLLGDLLARNSDWPDSDEVSTRLAPFAKLAIVQAEAQIEQIMMQRQMMQTQMLMGGMPGAPAPDGFQQGPQPTPGPRPA